MKEKVVRGEFYFDPDLWIFKTHFPGFPVVPGTMIIDKFIHILEKNLEYSRLNIEIRDFKFKKFLRPGRCFFEMYIKANEILCFLFDNQKDMVSRGKIILNNE